MVLGSAIRTSRSVVGGVVVATSGGLTATLPFVVLCGVQSFSPGVWPLLRFAALLAHRRLLRARCTQLVDAVAPQAGAALASLLALPALVLEPLAAPALYFLLVPPLLRFFAPPVFRSAVFYRHSLPVIVGYLRTLYTEAPAALRAEGEEAAQAVWDARHEWGAARVDVMLRDLSGF